MLKRLFSKQGPSPESTQTPGPTPGKEPGKEPGQKRVITFGTFDLLHEGHINILKRARAKGDYLIVGVSTDNLNALKGKSAMFSQNQRKAYLEALEMVDETFFEESLDLKDEYIKRYHADLLVMGDDWKGQFDWVSCEVSYLPRTKGVSSSELKSEMLSTQGKRRVLFGDTYITKHYHCAISMVNEMMDAGIAPVFTQTMKLPRNLRVDCLVYFNKPAVEPPREYADVPRICIDHGASNLKWFLAGKERFQFFDRIITAGPDHSRSILTLFPESGDHTRVHSAGFIKSPDLLSPARFSRDDICTQAKLDPAKPIILFVPTWYIARNVDIQIAIDQLSEMSNHVAVLHPETWGLDVDGINVMENSAGIVTELMKHADCIVSDLSSTIFEAAPLNKPVVQILMREYSDNNATMYDFPYVAGTADLFCGGVSCRPEHLRETISDVLQSPGKYAAMMAACQRRILQGTVMNDQVASTITSELLIACKEPRQQRDGSDLDDIKAKGLVSVHSNLEFQRLQLIAHGGGNYKSHHASNSLEAIKASLNAIKLVEVDLVLGKDDIFLAHNGFEEKYGFDKPFTEVSHEEFLQAKFGGYLSTLNLDGFLKLLSETSGKVVFDIKNTDEEYTQIAGAIAERIIPLKLDDRVIIQAYTKKDFEVVHRLGFKRAILAVWKYFYLSPLGDDAVRFIEECLKFNDRLVQGISIPYYNHHMPAPSIDMDELLPFFSYFKRVFIHGAPQDRYPEMLRRNLGIFADALKPGIQFKDVSGRFGWRKYLFLNPGLVTEGIDNQISATCHYKEWGEREGRLSEYDVPGDFVATSYIDKNPDLKLSGVVGSDTARAHWTRFGAKQPRRY